jgi:hypothetical protein
VKSLRTDQHIRHLTKELSAAKLALERERKLRSLQMDAIKVSRFTNKETKKLFFSNDQDFFNALSFKILHGTETIDLSKDL